MEHKDHYKTLGLMRGASSEDVKKAYRRLARKYHPDVSTEPNAEERFKAIAEAYEILSDPEKRSTYDRLEPRWDSTASSHWSPPPDWNQVLQTRHSRLRGTGRLRAFLESLFGDGLFRSAPHHGGEDKHIALEISLEESYRGGMRVVELPRNEDSTAGSALARPRSLNVKIPAGISNGQKIRLTGQGKSGSNGKSRGDLYLDIVIRPHALFQVDERDIILELPLTPWEAALGTRLEAPTLGGKVTLNIPANSQSGQKLRLRGRGLPGDPPGDQYVVLRIVNPPAHSQTAQSLFQRMARELSFDPRVNLKK